MGPFDDRDVWSTITPPCCLRPSLLESPQTSSLHPSCAYAAGKCTQIRGVSAASGCWLFHSLLTSKTNRWKQQHVRHSCTPVRTPIHDLSLVEEKWYVPMRVLRPSSSISATRADSLAPTISPALLFLGTFSYLIKRLLVFLFWKSRSNNDNGKRRRQLRTQRFALRNTRQYSPASDR